MRFKCQSPLLVIFVAFCCFSCCPKFTDAHKAHSFDRYNNATVARTLGGHAAANGRKALASDHSMCGTPPFDANVMKRINDIAKKKRSGAYGKVQESSILVKTRFIVVTDASGNGDVGNANLTRVIASLNTNYAAAGSKFHFQYVAAIRVVINNAVNTPVNDYLDQLGQHRRGGLDVMNIFIVPNMGFAGFVENWFSTGDLRRDRVVLLRDYIHDTTPTHEVGHWLGVGHVFDSVAPYDTDPCNPNNPQDYVADTPQVRAATPYLVGCGYGRDTCQNIPGLDPTDNYMDYGDEYDPDTGNFCKTKFTPGQVARMHDVWYYFRVLNEVCAINEMQVTLKVKFDNYPWETSWNITFPNGTLVNGSLSNRQGFSLGAGFESQLVTFNFCLTRQQYVFHLYDSYGDGIDPPGYYELRVNGQLIAHGGQEFDDEVTITLRPVGQRPNRKPTRRPTRKPIR